MAAIYIANPSPNRSLRLTLKSTSISCSPTSLSPRSPFPPQFVPPAASFRVPKGLQVIGGALHFYKPMAHACHSSVKSSERELEEEKSNVKQSGGGSEDAWEQVLASFKEQALKLQSVSQEVYEVYSKKALVVLKETADELKIQADKARYDLGVISGELNQEGKYYLAIAAENSPESIKDVVETFASPADDNNDISKLQDFYIGVPYGTFLSLGGFLNFMLTGSISAIRFGVILGGILLALSVFSLRSWRKGEPSKLALAGQAVIASILFLKDARVLSQGQTFTRLVTTLIRQPISTQMYGYSFILRSLLLFPGVLLLGRVLSFGSTKRWMYFQNVMLFFIGYSLLISDI